MNFTTVAMDMIVNHAAKLSYMSGGQSERADHHTHHDRRGNGYGRPALRLP